MDKQERIAMIEKNLEEGREKYNRGEITRAQWERIQRDAKNRIKEINREK